MEFMILVGAVLFFFAVFFLAIQENMSDKLKEKQNLIVKEITFTVKNEIELASESTDGYIREFEIQEKVGSQNYDITITENMVYVKTQDEKIAIALPILDITGQIQKGTNTIKKENGVVYLN